MFQKQSFRKNIKTDDDNLWLEIWDLGMEIKNTAIQLQFNINREAVK